MSTHPIFSLIGKLTVVAGVNDAIDWWENQGGGPFNLSTTVAAGIYWPGDLAIAIAAAMTTESAISGDTITYTGTFNQETAKMTIVSAPGEWFPKITTAESASVFTGGKLDTVGGNLVAGQFGPNHCGFYIDSAYPSSSPSWSSDTFCAHCFIPNEPTARDSLWVHDQSGLVSEAQAIDGSSNIRDWRGWDIDGNDPDFASWGGNWSTREIGLEFITQDIRAWWIAWLWGPYGKSGNTFRFYPDSSSVNYDSVVRLAGESLSRSWRGDRLQGYAFYSHQITLKREALQ